MAIGDKARMAKRQKFDREHPVADDAPPGRRVTVDDPALDETPLRPSRNRGEERLLTAYHNLSPAGAERFLRLAEAAALEPVVFTWRRASEEDPVDQLVRLIREAREAFRPTPTARHVIDVGDWVKSADIAIAKRDKR